MGFLTHMTSMAGCYRIAQLSSALEALLFELQEKPAAITASSRHTIRSSVALLVKALERAEYADEQCLSPTTVLIVDDDTVSNRALGFALSRVKLHAGSVTDPFDALKALQATRCDVILLDINLPGMNGIVLWEKLRALPMHHHTPVIFITSYTEYESRARAILGSGGDVILKPILPIELTVKIVSHVLEQRMSQSPS